MERPNNSKHILAMLAILTIVGSMTGCYYDNEEELYPFAGNQCDTLLPLSYNGIIQPIMQQNCAISGCHTGVNPTGGLRLDTYTQVSEIALNGDMSSRVIVNRDMPPSGPLSACDISALQAWIDLGAPEN